ncbi:MAG: hypothetical protein HYS05_07530 [Acidobacteria bacterium]|nr:hypothetical protein [Acidobacteriota bacterium]
MNARLSALGATLRRLLPIIVALVVVAVGFMFFVEPRVAELLRRQTESRGLENRVATLRSSIDRAGRTPASGQDEVMRQFEARTPAEDKVADVIEMVAKRALDPKAPGRLRGLLIEAGQRASFGAPDVASVSGPRVAGTPTQPDAVDPRLALFGGPFDYTPISLSFLSTYDRVGDFFWRCRDLPTTVEIRTVEITRGLPLVKVRMTMFVFQRPAVSPGTAPLPTAKVAD